MKMPPLHLIGSFLSFAGSRNMIEAAQSLGISQPALTQHMKDFESYFTQDVFALEGRRKTLTTFGQQLNDLLKLRFEGLDKDIKVITDKFEQPQNITVRVAGRGEILNSLAKQVSFPGKLIFVNVDGAAAVSSLIDRQYDIAVSNHLKMNSYLHAKKIFSDQFSILFPKSFLPGNHTISKTVLLDLCSHPYLSYADNDERLKALFQPYKIDPLPFPSKVLSNWESLIEMVNLQQGWTIAPTRFPFDSQKVSRILIPKTVIPGTEFFVFYRKESISMPWFRELINQFKFGE